MAAHLLELPHHGVRECFLAIRKGILGLYQAIEVAIVTFVGAEGQVQVDGVDRLRSAGWDSATWLGIL